MGKTILPFLLILGLFACFPSPTASTTLTIKNPTVFKKICELICSDGTGGGVVDSELADDICVYCKGINPDSGKSYKNRRSGPYQRRASSRRYGSNRLSRRRLGRRKSVRRMGSRRAATRRMERRRMSGRMTAY